MDVWLMDNGWLRNNYCSLCYRIHLKNVCCVGFYCIHHIIFHFDTGLPAVQPSSRLDSGLPPKKKSRFKTRRQDAHVSTYQGETYQGQAICHLLIPEKDGTNQTWKVLLMFFNPNSVAFCSFLGVRHLKLLSKMSKCCCLGDQYVLPLLASSQAFRFLS